MTLRTHPSILFYGVHIPNLMYGILIAFFLLISLIPSVAAIGSPSLVWTQATVHTPFSERSLQSAVVFNNALWVIGGAGPDSQSFNDVWFSSDGTNWKQATAHAQFSERSNQASVVFNNKIWVIGGRDGASRQPLNDVWYSSDGVTWTEATANAPFAPRWDFGTAVFDGKIWVIGGTQDGITHNDVWYSSDGATWTEATASAGFSPRMNLKTVVFNNKLWMTGGFDWQRDYSDVWYSSDGVTWTETTTGAAFQDRRYHGFEAAGDGLWVIGGLRDYVTGSNPFYDDVWYSSDGVTWTQVTDNAAFLEEAGISTAFFNNRLWVIGGNNGNSVWYSSDLTTLSPGMVAAMPLLGSANLAGSGIQVNKSVSPWSMKQGTDTEVTVTIFNPGPLPLTDVEILDRTIPDLPVVNGSTQDTIPRLEPNETYSLVYTLHAPDAGTFTLNESSVMFADADGNYHIVDSNAPTIVVLAPLIPLTQSEGSGFVFVGIPDYLLFGAVVIIIIVALYLITKKKKQKGVV